MRPLLNWAHTKATHAVTTISEINASGIPELSRHYICNARVGVKRYVDGCLAKLRINNLQEFT
jgi:hypothetical protein